VALFVLLFLRLLQLQGRSIAKGDNAAHGFYQTGISDDSYKEHCQ
jgi:hypothetical protein